MYKKPLLMSVLLLFVGTGLRCGVEFESYEEGVEDLYKNDKYKDNFVICTSNHIALGNIAKNEQLVIIRDGKVIFSLDGSVQQIPTLIAYEGSHWILDSTRRKNPSILIKRKDNTVFVCPRFIFKLEGNKDISSFQKCKKFLNSFKPYSSKKARIEAYNDEFYSRNCEKGIEFSYYKDFIFSANKYFCIAVTKENLWKDLLEKGSEAVEDLLASKGIHVSAGMTKKFHSASLIR